MAEAKAPAALEAPSTAKVSPSSSAAPHKSLVEHLEDEDETAVYALLMPAEYTMKEGAQLWQGVRLGKFLGAGVQAKVFQLARDDGHPTGKVIKINHGDIGSKMLNNNVLWIGMDREWEIGTQLRAALQEPGGAVAGFMKVCDCLVTRKGSQGAFSGMLMEELHGWEVYKRIDTPEFHNIHYVREMLFQVFSALDRAQRKLGFHHADLGMRNIMEHYPRIWERLPAEEGARAKEEALKYKGYSCNADGSRLPLGPELEFKIIDFGVAKFSSKLAAAAGGPEAQEVVERLQEKFGQRERIRFGHDHSPASIEIEPSDVTKDQSRTSKLRNWLKLPGKNRITVIVRPALKPVKALHSAVSSAANRGPNGRASPAPSSSVGGAAAEDDASAGSEWQPIRLTAFEEPGYKQAESAVVEERRAKKKGRRKKKSPIETMYRHFWHRKGDVFHLCLGMALALDDRCWPEEDEDLVAAFCSLVHHVTGVKLRVRTAEGEAGDKTFGRRKWQHWFRRWHIRLKSHVLPYNSGLLAREALSHPFFGSPGVRHAELPAALSKAFPAPEEA